MSIEENKAIIRRWADEVWTQGNLDVVDEVIHPNPRNPRGSQAWSRGPESARQYLARWRKGSPDTRREIKDMVVEGDKVVLYSIISGTHTGVWEMTPFAPTGEQWTLPVVATFVIEDGKMVEEPWSSANVPAVMQQIAKAMVRQYVEEVWNRGDLSAADRFIAADYVRHDPASPEGVSGLEGLRQLVAMYRAAFPDLQIAIEDVVAEGNTGDKVVVRWTSSGAHRGELMGIPPTGKGATSAGISFLRIADGKIAEEWVHWDNLGLLQQLGAIPPMGESRK